MQTGSVEQDRAPQMGTAIGTALGTVVGPSIGDHPWLFVPALGVGGVTVYRANASKAAYAWILGGVTALMVTYEAHSLASIRATASFAALRITEVAVGTLACLLVASVFHFGPKWYRKNRAPLHASNARAAVLTPPLESVRPSRMLLGLQAALSSPILGSLAYVMHQPGFAQAMVTAIAVLIVPPGLAADSTRQQVMEKIVQRVAGCLLAGMLGVALLPLMQGQAMLFMLALPIGGWTGSSSVGRPVTRADAAIRNSRRNRCLGGGDARDRQPAQPFIGWTPHLLDGKR